MSNTFSSSTRFVYRALVTNRFAICILALCQVMSAATYWVNPGGNDSNSGSSDSPFRTVARGTSQAAPGDTIILQDGVYGNEGQISDGSGGMHGYAVPVNISNSGAPGAYITLKAQNKWKAILDCGTNGNNLGCDKYIYLSSGASYWVFQDLMIERGAYGGLGTDQGASNIGVVGCYFLNIGNWDNPTQIGEEGLGFDHTSYNWWIEGNAFTNIGRNGGTSLDHGIYAAGSNVLAINNAFFNIQHGWGIQLANGASNWEIANNTFAFPNPAVPGQIVMWNQNNNINIENNIFYNPNGVAVYRFYSTVNGCVVDHNIVSGTSSIISDSTGCSVGSNGLNMDPQFVSPNQPYNFRIQSTSPAIGGGIFIPGETFDFEGNVRPLTRGFDIGASEFSTSQGSVPDTASPAPPPAPAP